MAGGKDAGATAQRKVSDVLAKAREALAKKASLKRKLDELKEAKRMVAPPPARQANELGQGSGRAAFELIQAPEGATYGRRRGRSRAFQFLDEDKKREKNAHREEVSAPKPREATPRALPPDIEWWDAKILVNKQSYPDEVLDEALLVDKLTHYVEHPEELEPVFKEITLAPAPLKLTRKEVKKLRTQRRTAREEEKQQLIRQGLLEPPKPKVKLSNLMRVLTADATADPTAIEQKVAKEMARRHAAHEDRNLARMLSPAERRQKKMKKLLDVLPGESLPEIHVAVYRINHPPTPQNRFKIEVNAFENHLTGACIVGHDATIVIVEGGPKTLRRYEHLMMRRIKWHEDGDDGGDGGGGGDEPPCKLAWTGVVTEKAFSGKFRCIEADPRRLLEEKGVEHYMDVMST